MPSDLPSRATPPQRSRGRFSRWSAIVGASLAVHLAVIDAIPRWTPDVDETDDAREPLRAVLVPIAVPAPAEPAPPPAPTARGASAKPRPAPRAPRGAEFVPESEDRAIPEVALGTAPPALPAASPPSPEPSPPAPIPPPPAAPEALAPSSARLSYKVVYVDLRNPDPVRYYGVGTIDWSSGDGRYRSGLVAAVDFLLFKVNVLASQSEGSITGEGVAPDRYTESPRRRATVAVNFNRDARQSISFSSSAAVVPLVPGAQDRLSVLFQIGALLRGAPERAGVEARFEIPVAGVRGDVETWVFENRGVETIEADIGALTTAHLRRAPKPDSNDRGIDVWIAHRDGGYPARVVYTEPDGSTVEMMLEKIE
jgi:Protein of unknown function (DUF3108)